MPAVKQFSFAPEQIHDDLYAIPLPIWDGSPVNSYVAVGPDGLYLIDGGLGTEHCQATLADGLEQLGYGMTDLKGLIVTHGHGDHVGAADTVIANGGQVLTHRIEATEGRELEFDSRWLVKHGMPEDLVINDRWREIPWPDPTGFVEDGQALRWGNLDLEVVWCPGHTPGLICLLERDRRVLFTTDHVMRRAPSPISHRHDSAFDPLGQYLASVAKLRDLPVDTVLPGHGRPFGDLNGRLSEIERDFTAQLARIRAKLSEGPASAYEILMRVQGVGDRREVALRYALSQVLSRLQHLVAVGDARRIQMDDGTIEFALAG